jgi:hypothetical protein
MTLTEVNTIQDFQKLPSSIRHIINGGKGKVTKAEKSWALQNAVALAIYENWISLELGIEILILHNAYGTRGKQVLKNVGFKEDI